MNIIKTKFSDVFLLEPRVFSDDRGFFMESYKQKVLDELNISVDFIQDNHSLSTHAGIIRGLHYQLEPESQTKLIRCARGAIYDVVVDIRKESPEFGNWFGTILTEGNKRQLLIPQGYAHGFCTLVNNSEVLYKVDNYYSPKHDRGIIWNDPDIGIDWPVTNPILSEKDNNHPLLVNAEINFTI